MRKLIYLMHGKIREQNDHVVLNSNDQASVTLISTRDHFNVVAHLEIPVGKMKLIDKGIDQANGTTR